MSMSRRGFAAMDPEKIRAIASKGGKAAHAAGTAHTFSSEEAQIAGKKGGNAPHKSRGKQARGLPKEDQETMHFEGTEDEDGACADPYAVSE